MLINSEILKRAHLSHFFLEMTSLGMGWSLWQLSALAPRLAPILLFSDLLEIESALPKIKTAQLEIEIALLEIERTIINQTKD